MNLTDQFERVADCIYGYLRPPHQFVEKLQPCQGFKSEAINGLDRIKNWKGKTGLSWRLTNKILTQIEVFEGPKIRSLISKTVRERQDIFADDNLFIMSFGESAKSGEVIFYDFRHTEDFEKRFKLRNSSDIDKIPPKSRIVFVDDMIGTGTQSVAFITKKLYKLLSPSHRPCLFSICGTTKGIEHVRKKSGFEVVCARELKEECCDFFHPENKAFSEKEKQKLIALNALLGRNEFDLGLLMAFYYGTPNNTMPMIWKNGWQFTDANGKKDTWYALLPRKY